MTYKKNMKIIINASNISGKTKILLNELFNAEYIRVFRKY